MLPIYILWLAVITLSVYFVYLTAKGGKKCHILAKKILEWILFLGSLAFLIGILGQVVGLMGVMEALTIAGMASPEAFASGIRVSLLAPVHGIILFIFSFVIWYLFRFFCR